MKKPGGYLVVDLWPWKMGSCSDWDWYALIRSDLTPFYLAFGGHGSPMPPSQRFLHGVSSSAKSSYSYPVSYLARTLSGFYPLLTLIDDRRDSSTRKHSQSRSYGVLEEVQYKIQGQKPRIGEVACSWIRR